MAASHLRSSLVTFDFTGTLDRDLPLSSPRFNIAPEQVASANIPVIIRGGEKGSGVINAIFKPKSKYQTPLAPCSIFTLPPPLISSPLCTSSYHGASFVSCADANFFVRPASCLFSLCAGINQRVVCGWEFCTTKRSASSAHCMCGNNPRENREILRRQNRSASRFHRPFYIARMR